MRVLAVSHPCVVDVNQRIYAELEAQGHEVLIVVPSRWRHEFATGTFGPVRLAALRGELRPLPVWRAGSVPLHAYRRGVQRIMREAQPTVVYVEEEPYSVAALQWSLAARRCSAPVAFYSAQNIAKRYPWPVRQAEAVVWRCSGMAVCVTRTVLDTLRARGYGGPASIVPLGVDVSRFAPRPADVALKRALGLRRHVVGYLGRLVEEKGIRVLLEAYLRLPQREETSLLCLGDGPLAGECRAHSGVVIHPVAHAEVADHLALVDVLAMPSLTTASWREQFGRAAVEAMACEVPVVGSDSGEIPTILRQTGGGVVVREGDATALGAELKVLLEDEAARRRLGRSGREAVVATLSIAVAGRQLASALLDCVRSVNVPTTGAHEADSMRV